MRLNATVNFETIFKVVTWIPFFFGLTLSICGRKCNGFNLGTDRMLELECRNSVLEID